MCCPAAVGKAFGQSGLAVSGLKLTGGEDCQPETKSVFFRFGFPLFETPPPALPPLLVPQAASSPGPSAAAAPSTALSRRNSRRVCHRPNVDIAPLPRSHLRPPGGRGRGKPRPYITPSPSSGLHTTPGPPARSAARCAA